MIAGLWLAFLMLVFLASVAIRKARDDGPLRRVYMAFSVLLAASAVSVYDAIQRAIFP